MSLTLEIVSWQGRSLGKDRTKTFGLAGGTIGRSVEADWSLPDANRFLSNRHASIDFRSGSYYLVDTSKNGVFINDDADPIGLGKPQRLFTGDRIRLGDYEISVRIENVDDTDETLMSFDHVDPVDAAEKVDSPDPTGIDLIEAHAMTGVGIEMRLEDDELDSLKLKRPPDRPRKEGPSKIQPGPAPAARSGALARQAATRRSPGASVRPVKAAPKRGLRAVESDLFKAFFRGAAIDAPELTDAEAVAIMVRMGQVMRELVGGVIDCLQLRALQKAQLQQSSTVIEPLDNNRLKFSATVEDAFARLFLDDSGQFLGPTESVRGSFADIKTHQRWLLSATRAALNEYLERLDPQEIESSALNGRKGGLISATNKLKYWDLYKEVYFVLANQAGDEFPQPFLEALADSYRQAQRNRQSVIAATKEAG